MSFQNCRLLYPLLWGYIKNTPEGRLNFLRCQWRQLVGAPLSSKTRPSAFEGAKVVITVCSQEWLDELKKMSNVLVRRINKSCSENCVRKVTFRVGPVGAAERLPHSAGGRVARDHGGMPPKPLENFGHEIKDETLRKTVAAAAAKNLELRGR